MVTPRPKSQSILTYSRLEQLKTLITLTIAHGNLYIYNTMANFITLKLHFKLITLKLLYITEHHVAIKQKRMSLHYHGNHRLNTELKE